jgi:hypothetical protein
MILFLDFDGVLHPYGGASGDNFCELPRLVALLREPACLHVEIVVSSAWRMVVEALEDGVFTASVRPLQQMRQYFPPDLQHRVIGVTPYLGELGGGAREQEIRQWLADNAEPGRPWVALDDYVHLFTPGCPNLVVTESATGLDDALIVQLRQRLAAS